MLQKPQHILVVDDDPVIRDMMVDLLELEGYTIHTARNGHDALDILHTAHASEESYLIFLDLMMPVMNGPEFIHQLETNVGKHHHIIVVMSAMDHLSATKDLNIHATMSKPFVIEDIMRIINKYMLSY